MKNTKLTPEQKKMEREYARMQSVVTGASFGQQSLRPIDGKYSDFQHAAYATYQSQIDAAQARMRQLKEIAAIANLEVKLERERLEYEQRIDPNRIRKNIPLTCR